jgi:hypothetical protein
MRFTSSRYLTNRSACCEKISPPILDAGQGVIFLDVKANRSAPRSVNYDVRRMSLEVPPAAGT